MDQVEQDKIEQQQHRDFAKMQMKDRIKQDGLAKTGAGMIKGAGKAMGELDKKGLIKGTKIKAKEHRIGAWIIAIILAVAKDLLDIGTIELASGVDWIVDIVIGVTMFFLFGKSMKLTRKLIVSIGSTIAEVVPGLGFLPVWTLSVMYLYLKAGQEEE